MTSGAFLYALKDVNDLMQERLGHFDSVEAAKAHAESLVVKGFASATEGFDWRPNEIIPEDYHAASGGRVDMSRGGTMPNTGQAESGADWHPAWLTDKEFVVNAKSSAQNRNALAAANANPDVKLTPHYASGFNPVANAMRQVNRWTSTPGTPGNYPGPGQQGPVRPGTVGTPGIVPEELIQIAGIAGGPIGQTVVLGAVLIGKAQQAQYESVIKNTAAIGEWTRSLANPDSDPSKIFGGAGDLITAGGEKLSKTLNNAINPIGSMLGLDLFPHLKQMTGIVGETAKQFGALMQAVSATAERYGEYSPDIAVAQAMVEVQHTMGELRRANESGPELARYLRAQGDLQQKVEDIKIKLLTKLLPLVTFIVASVEKGMAAGEGITGAITALASPLALIVEVARRIANIQEDANRDDIADPTEVLFQNPGPMQGQGVGIPPAQGV